MNRSILFFSFIFFLILSCISLRSNAQYSQSNPSFSPVVFPQPPNSASFEKFSSFPVSYYTGLPEISIPVCTVSSGSLKVPITISYHASGIKVSEVASWVGIGWSLIAGGEITRKVMGAKPDEYGFLNGDMRTMDQIDPATDDGQYYLEQVIVNNNDCEPDIFSYNYPGGSGRFFFNKSNNYQPALIPYAPIQINYTNNNSVLSFSILDESGNRYTYGINSETSGADSYVTSGWMLDQIVSADKADTITFKYATQSGLTYDDIIDTRVVDDNVWCGADPNHDPCPYSANPQASVTTKEVFTYTTEKALQEIDFKNGKIVFNLSNSNREDVNSFKSLANIQLYRFDYNVNDYRLQKTFSLFQSYFENGTDVSTKRLRLDSLKLKDATGIDIEKYSFDYNTLTPPAAHSRQKDFWGYYNGKNNDNLIPRQQIDYTASSQGGTGYPIWIGSSITNGRDPDTVLNQACMLKTIHYPTGGHTDFYFETNRYVDAFDNSHLSGGLRIKTIVDYDAITSTINKKTYEYNASRPNYDTNMRYYYLSSSQNHDNWVPTSAGSQKTASKRTRTYISEPSISLIPSDGSIVVYPIVTEYNGDAQNNAGKTIYTFTDYPDVLQTASSVKPVITDYSYRRGQLTGKLVYRRNGSDAYQPVSKEINTYSVFPQTIYDAIGLTARQQLIQDGIGPFMLYQLQADWLFNTYSATSDDNYLSSKTALLYDENDSNKLTQSITNIFYNNIAHQQPTKIITNNSKGEAITTYTSYPLDYNVTGYSSLIAQGVRELQNTHVINAPVETYKQISDAAGGNVRTVSGVLKTYKSDIPEPDSIYILSSSIPITTFTPLSINSLGPVESPVYRPIIKFDKYNSQGNLTQQHKVNDKNVSYLWGYNNSLPVAEVKNATTDKSAYSSFESDGKGNWLYSGTTYNTDAVTGDRAYALSTGAITLNSLSTSDSFVVSYWSKRAAPYDVSGDLLSRQKTGDTVRGWTYHEHLVTGVSSVTISFPSGFTGSSWIDEVRLYPIHAQMATYTYETLIGLTSQCDLNNKITYYEYDELGRLDIIRDQHYNIVKKYCYNYAGVQSDCNVSAIYFSKADTAFDVRRNCGANQIGTITPYIIKAGRYVATLSQAGADQKADDDTAANAQSYANANGACIADQPSTVKSTNSSGTSFTAVFINRNTSQQYSFTLNTGTSETTVGTLTAGTYDVKISHSGNTTPYAFHLNCFSGDFFVSGSSAYLYNMNVSGGTTTITIPNNQQ